MLVVLFSGGNGRCLSWCFRGLISIITIIPLVSFGCADETARDTVAPQHPGAEEALSSNFGHFRIVLDEDTYDLAIEPDAERNAQYDVTEYAEISIPYSSWDAGTRTWTLTVYLKNPTALQGYGVWGVFTEMGGKEFAPPDGFIIPRLRNRNACRSSHSARARCIGVFPSMYTDSRFVSYPLAEGVNNWIALSFT